MNSYTKMQINQRIAKILIEASHFYAIAADEDDVQSNARYMLITKELLAAGAAVQQMKTDNITSKGLLLDMLVMVAADYEKKGFYFLSKEVEEVVDDLSS